MSDSSTLPVPQLERVSYQETACDSTDMAKPQSLALILAATPSLGIGKGGTLPWPQLKKEMGYFARVTKRVSTPSSTAGKRKVNAVLMGRKTWDSIPPKFRPLKDRLNIVITRNADDFSKTLNKKSEIEGPVVASGVVDALSRLEDSNSLPSEDLEVDQVYVIGGATIYRTALELPQTKRVLLTKIHNEYECDTFFSINVEESTIWKKASRKEVEDFTGETLEEGGIEEQGVKFEFCMFERE